jgi:hypothetical protein
MSHQLITGTLKEESGTPGFVLKMKSSPMDKDSEQLPLQKAGNDSTSFSGLLSTHKTKIIEGEDNTSRVLEKSK